MAYTPATTPGESRGFGGTRQVNFEPVVRVAGALGLRTTIDHDRQEVTDASALATLFRGYENVLEGRDPRDAIFVASRICGACGSSHAVAAAQALEMAFDIQTPPMAVATRNLLTSTENLYGLTHHLFILAGPDFSEPTVRATNPELWSRAEGTIARGVATHGFERISDIMGGLTRVSGELYAEALYMARVAREGYVLIGGKFPHPQTTVPGGISSTVDRSDMNVYLLRVVKFFDYARKAVAVWDDLIDFFYEANPRYREVGARRANMIDFGYWDDPWAYDSLYENASRWGEQRWCTPGALIDGRLSTTDLQRLHGGIEESVDRSFYEQWSGQGGSGDSSLSQNHPWNKETIPAPASPTGSKYSWSAAARWDRQAMEAGPGARLWITSMANRSPHRLFCEPTGSGMRMSVPQASLPAAEIEWQVPQSWGAFERNRSRAYALLHGALCAYDHVLMCLDLIRKGEDRISVPYSIPRGAREGMGLWSSPRGLISHHMTMNKGAIESYQVVTHSTFNAGPRDGSGQPSALEEAVIGTPLLSTPGDETYIDVLRAIRSFDPCMSCATQ
jgi:hydrogenase large subunit